MKMQNNILLRQNNQLCLKKITYLKTPSPFSPSNTKKIYSNHIPKQNKQEAYTKTRHIKQSIIVKYYKFKSLRSVPLPAAPSYEPNAFNLNIRVNFTT